MENSNFAISKANISIKRRTRGRVISLWIGLSILLLFLVASILTFFLHKGAYEGNLMKTFLPPQWQSGGSNSHFLGTDELGRDLLSRIFYGIRESLLIGPVSVILASILGLTFGLLSGYRGGWLDSLLMRITDGILSIPILLLAISVIGVLGASTVTLILVLAISQWMSFVRLIRAKVIQLRQKQFILASRAIGANEWRIMFKHLLPHLIPSALVLATLSLPEVILLAAGLNFLGIGSTPPEPTLGGLISGGLKYLVNAPWMAIAPGLALMFLVVGINMVAESVREKLEQSE